MNNLSIDKIKNLEKIIPKENIKQKEMMKNHTSFKIGGPAEIFVKITKLEELKNLLKYCKENNEKLTIIGNGSNLLISDEGIKGIVAKIEMKGIQITQIDKENYEIKLESGVVLGFFAQKLLKEEIQGFEELSGIPGTIGGAIVMNAGAHGKEIKDIVLDVTAIDYEGKMHTFTNEKCQFSYRHSKFSEKKYIILEARILLKKGNIKEIKEKMNEYAKYRKEKQPIEYPSAGSTFKRGEDFITAKLIDEAGLKGYLVGGAQISEKHAGFIINTGNATSQDVLDLVKYTKEKVYEKFKKNIELEIKYLC